MKNLDDETLMQSYQKGDIAAFGELYRRYSPRVYGYLKTRLTRKEERDEVFQQIFLKLHRSKDGFSPKYKFVQWLFVIARTGLIDHFRKNQKAKVDWPQIDPSPSEGLSENDWLKNLTLEQRNVVNWRIIDELSYEEIAQRLKKTTPTVRQILSRTIKKLRHSIQLEEGR